MKSANFDTLTTEHWWSAPCARAACDDQVGSNLGRPFLTAGGLVACSERIIRVQRESLVLVPQESFESARLLKGGEFLACVV